MGSGPHATRRAAVFDRVDYLVGVDDKTRQNALRYLDAEGRLLAHSWPSVPRITELEDLRRLASTPIENVDPASRSRLIGSGASVGGARPKACVVDADGALAIARFTTDQDTVPIERVEVATLRLAADVGIDAAVARTRHLETGISELSGHAASIEAAVEATRSSTSTETKPGPCSPAGSP